MLKIGETRASCEKVVLVVLEELIDLFLKGCQKNNIFSLSDCHFGMEKCKESTARVVVFKELNIMNSFTLEVSFFGKKTKIDGKFNHMSLPEYNSLGETLV